MIFKSKKQIEEEVWNVRVAVTEHWNVQPTARTAARK